MTRMNLTAASRFLKDNMDLRLVEQRGDMVDWACDRENRRFSWSHAEMAEFIQLGVARFRTLEGEKAPDDMPHPDTFTAKQRADAEHKLEYVKDLHAKSLDHRAPSKEFEEQLLATSKRLQDDAAPEAWTAKRWLKRCGVTLHWTKLVDRSFRKGNRRLGMSDDQLAIVDPVIDKHYLTRERLSPEGMLPLVNNAIRLANLDRPHDCQLRRIGRRALVSAIALREPRAVHKARYGEAAARYMFDRVELQADPKAPLDRIEIDHTRADLFVTSDEDGLPIGRPVFGFAIDRCTRMPFGLYVGFEPESVLSVMQILKNGIFPKTYVEEKRRSGEWNFKHGWPAWGMPRGLVFDRGMAGLSADLESAANEIGIRDVTFAAARSGNQKGAVERFFKTQNQQLLHQQRGTTFSNVVDRDDYDPAKNAVIGFSDFVKMAHRFLVDIYPHQPHSGLNEETPWSAWNRLIDREPSDPVMPIQQMVHLFTRSKPAVLRREGIRMLHIYYNSDELDAERLSADFAAKSPKRKVTFRYDPADLGAIWVLLPHRDRYLKVEATKRWQEYASGKSLWEHIQIQAHHRLTRGSSYDPDSLAESRAELVGDREAATKRTRSAARRTKKARMDGVGRTSPAGADGSTTPANSALGRRNATQPKAANDAPASTQTNVSAPPSRRMKRISLAPVGKAKRP